MNHLINLTLYKQHLEDELQNAKLKDCLLPESFKHSFITYRGYTFEYFNYTLKVSTAQGDCFIPNQWIYIGALCSQYHSELLKYKSKLIDFGITDDQFRRCHPGRDDKDISDTERTPEYLQSLATKYLSNYQDDDKELLVNFLYNYASWGGGKNINRGDFTTSPVLSIAHSINDSSGLIGILAQALSENTTLRQKLFESKEWAYVYPKHSAITKNEIFREKRAAAFLKKVIEETIKIDKNLSFLMQCGNIKTTTKRLQVNSFPLGCDTTQLPPRQSDYVSSIQWVYRDNTYLMYLEWTPEEMEKNFFPEYNKAYNLMFGVKKEGDFYIFYQFESTNTFPSIKTIPLQCLFSDAPNSAVLIPYLTALRTKPFMLLAGISGTGKSRIVRELAKACWQDGDEEYGKNNPMNFCMVQVKPNWHDSSELIGYVSRINGEKYVVGPFLRFMAKAIKDENMPYFLCLDEMNLAPVEQYFAEYLSVIESRKLNTDGSITTDPIIPFEDTEAYGTLIDQLFDTEADRVAYKSKDGKRLTIPQNLFVVGTVNMDETTFSFSRKVLDRAMTIEMNEVNLSGGLEEEGSEIGYIGNCIIGDAAEGKDVYAGNKDLCDKVITYLKKVNVALEGTPFKIAYRTRNEFLLYAVNRQLLDKDSQLWQTLDEMTSMKILSRIEGDSERTKEPLNALKTLVEQNIINQIPEPKEGETVIKSVSAAKIKEMLDKLDKTSYTSYWA